MQENNRVYTFEDNKKLTVINMFAGPSVGKSATAYQLAGKMKASGLKAEYVEEFAKGEVWESKHHIFTEQDYFLAGQHRLIRRLVRHDIDFAVMDSSMLLGLAYIPEWFPASFKPFLLDVYNSYDNVNIYLDRNPNIPYVQAGRNQSPEEAYQKDKEILALLDGENIKYRRFMSGDDAAQMIFEYVVNRHRLADAQAKDKWPVDLL
jgi:nicotinamide riboside kinase